MPQLLCVTVKAGHNGQITIIDTLCSMRMINPTGGAVQFSHRSQSRINQRYIRIPERCRYLPTSKRGAENYHFIACPATGKLVKIALAITLAFSSWFLRKLFILTIKYMVDRFSFILRSTLFFVRNFFHYLVQPKTSLFLKAKKQSQLDSMIGLRLFTYIYNKYKPSFSGYMRRIPPAYAAASAHPPVQLPRRDPAPP